MVVQGRPNHETTRLSPRNGESRLAGLARLGRRTVEHKGSQSEKDGAAPYPVLPVKSASRLDPRLNLAVRRTWGMGFSGPVSDLTSHDGYRP